MMLKRHHKIKGQFERKRAAQRLFWFERSLSEGLDRLLAGMESWNTAKAELREQVASGALSPFEAGEVLLERVRRNF